MTVPATFMKNVYMHAKGQLVSEASRNTFPVSPLCMVLGKVLWGGARERQQKLVHMNTGTGWLFTTTVLVGASGRVLATRPQNHGIGVKAGGVFHQSICMRTPLQRSSHSM